MQNNPPGLISEPRLSQAAALLCAAAIIVSWLNPFAPGPSPTVMPWLVTAVATLGVWCWLGAPQAPRAWVVALAASGMWLVVRGLDGPSPETVMALGGLVLLAIGAGTGARAAENPALLRGIAGAWLGAALLSAVIGLIQYLGLSHSFVPWINLTTPGDAFGNLRQRNQFASLLNMGVLALMWMVRSGFLRSRVVASLAVLILVAGNAASASRTGALQLVLIVVAVACWPGPARRRLVWLGLLGVVSYVVFATVLPYALEFLSGLAGGSLFQRLHRSVTCDSRLVLWSNVLELIAEHPWFGWGWGELDYAHFIHPYSGMRFCDILDNAHDLPLQLAVELGVPFASAVCAALVWAVVRGRPWRATEASGQLGWGVLMVIMLHSLLEYPLWYGPFQVAFGMAVGLVMGSPRVSGSRGAQLVPLAAGLCGLVLCGYALWDYHRVSQIYLPPQLRAPAHREDPLADGRLSWLFRGQARFAELTVTAPSRANATQMQALASETLHYSPEPKVIERAIESAALAGRTDEALLYLARYRDAFAREYQQWTRSNRLPDGAAVKD